MPAPSFLPLTGFTRYSAEEMSRRVDEFYLSVQRRRSVRAFSDEPVARKIIDRALQAAGTAPSGANLQPWHFVVVSGAETKRRIREAAETEERAFYERRAPQAWLDALAPLGTDSDKPFLELAPWLIAVFTQTTGKLPDGRTVKHYYPMESTGLATGILITALHHAGLACLTHTPSPMGFLNEILDRPGNERPYLLLITGYPAADVRVPDIKRKVLNEFVSYAET